MRISIGEVSLEIRNKHQFGSRGGKKGGGFGKKQRYQPYRPKFKRKGKPKYKPNKSYIIGVHDDPEQGQSLVAPVKSRVDPYKKRARPYAGGTPQFFGGNRDRQLEPQALSREVDEESRGLYSFSPDDDYESVPVDDRTGQYKFNMTRNLVRTDKPEEDAAITDETPPEKQEMERVMKIPLSHFVGLEEDEVILNKLLEVTNSADTDEDSIREFKESHTAKAFLHVIRILLAETGPEVPPSATIEDELKEHPEAKQEM